MDLYELGLSCLGSSFPFCQWEKKRPKLEHDKVISQRKRVTRWDENLGLLPPQPHGPIDNSFSLLLETVCVLLLTHVMSLVSDNIANYLGQKS